MRILIAPNSFKECADSVTIAELIASNLSLMKTAQLILKPISDGGDGFLNVCKYYFGGEIKTYRISTAYDESEINCPILYIESERKIYIESAEVLGLKAVPKVYRNPLNLSSKGLGELLLKINEDILHRKLKAEKIYMGIGGTATIDLGLGMMSRLGLKLMDSSDKYINVIPINYLLAEKLNYVPNELSFEVIPVLDVPHPVIGNESGVKVFGKQKGASEEDLVILEKSFIHMLNLFHNKDLEISSKHLSGAGGGIPAALQIFYKSNPISSSEFIKHSLGLKAYAGNFDFLVTGEGAYDIQTKAGKGVKILIDLFKRDVKKIFLICGKFLGSTKKNLNRNIVPIELTKFFKDDSESIINYKAGFEIACREIKEQINF